MTPIGCCLFVTLAVIGWLGRGDTAFNNRVIPSCSPDAEVCNFHFRVDYNMTMMSWVLAPDTGEPDVMLPVIPGPGRKLYAKRKDCSGEDQLSEEEVQELMTGDGTYKRIFAVNNQLPGEPIVVYKGQTVVVVVTNEMENEVMTLHWHGLPQYGTPWMDGGGGVSHCPIPPRQSFEYRFKAEYVGTYWYHGHIALQRTMGMAGPLTILDRNPEDEVARRGPDPLPPIDGEFHMMVSEWTERPTDEKQPELEVNDMAWELADGSSVTCQPFQSAIINGRGWRYNRTINEPFNDIIPLDVFLVKKGGKFRFRSVNMGINMHFKISIDNHPLHVIATDGVDVTTVTVDFLILSNGERYDFWIDAVDPTSAGNYWIHLENLEYRTFEGKRVKVPGHTEAILRYEGAPKVKPTSQRRQCTEAKPCVALNCPFLFYPASEHTKCIPVVDLRTPVPTPTLQPSPGDTLIEKLLSFEMTTTDRPAIINGKKFEPFSAPPQIYPKDVQFVPCQSCPEPACTCTHTLEFPKEEVVQLVFFSHRLVHPFIYSSAHPIHLHGYHFQVLKIGWPIYNSTSAEIIANSPDIDCSLTPDYCHIPLWANKTWAKEGVPGLLEEGAVWKDTVNVPSGGYVVVRIRTDNPGYWLMHCHMAIHNELGMMLVVKVGEDSDMPPVPEGFPVCGNFDWSSEEFYQKINNPKPPSNAVAVEDEAPVVAPCAGPGPSSSLYQATTAILATLLSFIVLILVVLIFRNVRSGGSGGQRQRGLFTETASHDIHESAPLLQHSHK